VSKVEASPEGLRVDDTFYPRAELKGAYVRKEPSETVLVIQRSSLAKPLLNLRVRDEAEADAIRRTLSLDAASATTEFTLAREGGIRRVAWALVLLALSVAGSFALPAFGVQVASSVPFVLGWFAFIFFFALAVAFLVPRSASARIVVGAEGVAIREGLKKSAFYPHAAIKRVETAGNAMTLTLEDGRALRYLDASLQSRYNRSPDLVIRASSVARRIEESREIYRRFAEASSGPPVTLERGSLPARDWVEQLRRVAEGVAATTFREASVTREELLRLVESASAAARDRLAAAIALRSAGMTEEEKPRVRIAVERCAVPELRERMARVLDSPEEDTFAKVLEEVERDAPAEEAGARGREAT